METESHPAHLSLCPGASLPALLGESAFTYLVQPKKVAIFQTSQWRCLFIVYCYGACVAGRW